MPIMGGVITNDHSHVAVMGPKRKTASARDVAS